MEDLQAKRDFWYRHVEAWKTSNLSQAGYCALHGIKVSNFYYWMSCGKEKPTAAKPLKLVPVVVGSTPKESELVLRSPSGWQLQLSSAVTADWLADLLRRLP